jgi:asparagine synthase (glutamine-hydrolysing)
MCGIAGIFDLSRSTSAEELRATAGAMADAIAHRGPDASGVWSDARVGIALSHRRLSIIDLSESGSQPMHSEDERYVLVFNGEIYNFEALRAPLLSEGARFRGRSDTEVLLAAFARWGAAETLKKADGMFALALWDRLECTLTLARDRFGEKPLYYGVSGQCLYFGSELKAIKRHPAFSTRIDRGALALFLRHNYVPAPHTIYSGIRKLPAGCFAVFKLSSSFPDGIPRPYWSAVEEAERAAADKFRGTAQEAIDELEIRLSRAVRSRMVSDVPLGAFLSGGIDSSAIVALMQANSTKPIRTFTIGFSEHSHNEATFAKAVAEHLGTDHTEHYVTPAEALSVIPELPRIYDEPFSDSSQIPTVLVCRLARQSVTVALSGDAGDELFGGYPRYKVTEQLWRRGRRIPAGVKAVGSALLKRVPVRLLNRLSDDLPVPLPFIRPGTLGDKVARISDLLSLKSTEDLYRDIVSHWRNASDIVQGAENLAYAFSDSSKWAKVDNPYLRLMVMDAVSYLPDDILVKVDRASMSCSLEVRVPLLDPAIADLGWRITPDSEEGINSKWPLKGVLTRYVPRHLIDRPKMGFGVPIDSWLRGPLRDWASDLLSESRLRREGFLEPRPIVSAWSEHLRGDANWHYYLWDILMFEAWLAAQ